MPEDADRELLTGALEKIFEVQGRLRDLAISPKYPEWIRVAILPLLDDALADLEQNRVIKRAEHAEHREPVPRPKPPSWDGGPIGPCQSGGAA
ncbi:MAG TPA: hypothetical protein VH063_08010 [Gaiellaceae bacterium]|jgi:hypothetical protein|nr:hypothetical protein [Gaiellaceae bacterium]